ncbi:MAG: hypothetical protein CSA62_11770 [Planctomycetota bacterium]|nr:MAG: hypothetical protein CSA62_11770 [Planctomycetota bacterium]
MNEAREQARETWAQALEEELSFWRSTMAAPPQDFLDRLDPMRPFRDPEAVQHLARNGRLRVLDVGSGPLTVFGYTALGCRIDLYPTDPLAHEYVRLLREAGHEAPVLPMKVEAERLPEVFPEQFFDCAYALNALDHCHDPVLALERMLSVTRVGGIVTLVHLEYVGRLENYAGLHQWDFFIEDEKAFLANRDRSRVHDLGAQFAPGAELIVCEHGAVEETDHGKGRSCRLRFRRLQAEARRPHDCGGTRPASQPRPSDSQKPEESYFTESGE